MNAEPAPVLEMSKLKVVAPAQPEPEPMTDEEADEAIAFGTQPNLTDAIVADYGKLGLVGERHNKLLCYVAAVSRMMDTPISVLVLSSSGAGKSTLQDKTLNLCPPEDVLRLSALTDKALFYKGRNALKNRAIALEEAAGVKNAYQLRTLISEGYLAIETVGHACGSLSTMHKRVEGPTAVFLTTTNPSVDPELASRMWVIGVDESREQTRRILEVQKHAHTLAGIIGKAGAEQLQRKHHNFQRLLNMDLRVVNPFAEGLFYADDRLTARRNQAKYLNLCKAVAFLRQLPKTVHRHEGNGLAFDYIEVEPGDILIATELATEILGKSLDGLSVPARDLLFMLHDHVCQHVPDLEERCRFSLTRRQMADVTGWTTRSRLHTHLKELLEAEYVVKIGKQECLEYYRLLWDGQGRDGRRFLIGVNPGRPE